MTDILFVIDMQNDFIDGALGSEEAQNIVDNVVVKIKEYKKAGKPIYLTMDTHEKNYLNTLEGQYLPVEHCIKDTNGWCINDKIADACETYDNYYIITKKTFGYRTIGEILPFSTMKIDSIEICGLDTDICVVSNALILRAYYPNKKIYIDSSCCAGTSKENHEAALKVMKSCQIEVI